MKKSIWLWFVMVFFVVGMSAQLKAQNTGQVYQLNATWQVVIPQPDSSGKWQAKTMSLTSPVIVNAALGNPPKPAPPANLVLALIVFIDANTPNELVVWDNQAKAVQVLVGVSQSGGSVDTKKSGAPTSGNRADLYEIQSAGSFINGYLSMNGSYRMTAGGLAMSTYTPTMNGFMVVNDHEGDQVIPVNLVLTSGKGTVKGPPIGKVVQ